MTSCDVKPCRGEVWLVDLDPTIGREQAKKRPCVIISNNLFNSGPADLVVVLPITSRYRKLSWLVEILPPNGGLKLTSYVISNQIRTVSKKRLSKKALGKLTQETLSIIVSRLQILLDI